MAQDLIRGVIVFFHVTSVIFWLIALVSTSFTYRTVKSCSKNGHLDSTLLKSGRNMLYLELIALFFVLLTGSALAGPKWFSLEAGTLWLTVKQVIFLILLVASISAFLLVRKSFMVSNHDEISSTEELLRDFRMKMMTSHVFSALILLNVFLAFVKPF